MDKSASRTVAQGTIITSAVSAFITGVYGITTRHPKYGFLAGAAALNSGITAATFFGLREYAVTPLLVSRLHWPQYACRRREISPAGPFDSEPSLSWSDIRTYNFLDSGLSGAITGGVLRGWRSGAAAILPGALTATAACIALQYAFNEAGITRLKYISRHTSKDEASATVAIQPLSIPVVSSPVEKFIHFVGLRKMSDEEYLESLKKTRNLHLQRITELENKIGVERKNDNDNP